MPFFFGETRMNLSKHDISRCVDLARDLAAHYHQNVLNGDSPCKRMDELIVIIQTYLEKKVTVRQLLRAKRSIKGVYFALQDGSYEINLLSGMDEDEERITLCKELFHVVIDTEAYHSTDLYGHVYEVVATFPVTNSNPSPSAQSEKLAELAAMEFLFPYVDRKAILEDNNNPDMAVIAARYGVPQGSVELFCSEPYMEFFAEFCE